MQPSSSPLEHVFALLANILSVIKSRLPSMTTQRHHWYYSVMIRLFEERLSLDSFEAFLCGSIFGKTAFCLGENQDMLENNACSSWYKSRRFLVSVWDKGKLILYGKWISMHSPTEQPSSRVHSLWHWVLWRLSVSDLFIQSLKCFVCVCVCTEIVCCSLVANRDVLRNVWNSLIGNLICVIGSGLSLGLLLVKLNHWTLSQAGNSGGVGGLVNRWCYEWPGCFSLTRCPFQGAKFCRWTIFVYTVFFWGGGGEGSLSFQTQIHC